MKRKRAELALSSQERDARIVSLRQELDDLITYYNNHCLTKNHFITSNNNNNNNNNNVYGSVNSMIACLVEESSLPLSKLVDSILASSSSSSSSSVKQKQKQKQKKEGGSILTPASLKNSVLLIAQRSLYGLHNLNAAADVFEDDSPSSLWCWETRDLKLLPKSCRGALKIRRTCRKKIHERITAVSAVITELMKPESTSDGGHKVMKASERLSKVLSEAEIRLLVGKMEQKNGGEVAEKEAKREEKQAVKRLEKNKREIEKEKARMEQEILKEKLHNEFWLQEKEQKHLQEDAEKEEKRRENEMKKQLKRQQEAEKEQRRREKEEAEQKKLLAVKKQASILERFVIRSKNNSPLQVEQSTTNESAAHISPKQKERVPDSVIESMDNALSLKVEFDANKLWRVHLDSWHQLGHCSSRQRHWGVRRFPKSVLVKELKLTSKGDDGPVVDKSDNGWTENELNYNANSDGSIFGSQKLSWCKQLLQFDKSHRPAFYGYWPQKSEVVRARCPLVKDPKLDYEIDSDEEWEEEEPGESLSDCEKEEDDESTEENLLKADDEDESEDGFFVPDGYLSENEGVEVDRKDHHDIIEDATSSPNCDQVETEELFRLFKQFKHLNSLTEHALRKNRPLLIFNLMHERSKSSSESEQMCLQALSIRAFPVGPSVEILAGNDLQEDIREDCPSSSKSSVLPVANGSATILDSDVPEIVSVIQSCPHGIDKVVKTLRLKFPNITKCRLGSKVREISVFADNRWQVKKDILDKFGLSSSPEKTTKGTKSIAAFFSKRCLPPAGKTTNPNQVSPQPMEKTHQLQSNAHNN